MMIIILQVFFFTKFFSYGASYKTVPARVHLYYIVTSISHKLNIIHLNL